MWPLHEWVVVIIGGVIGGLAATLATERARHAQPTRQDLLLNLFGGALGSFLLWATYTSSADFNSIKVSPSEVAASITVGLGGVSIIRSLMRQWETGREWKETNRGTMALLEKLLADQGIDDNAASTDNDEKGANHEHD